MTICLSNAAAKSDLDASTVCGWYRHLRHEEIRAMAAIQRWLFPPVPVVAGFDVAASCKAAHGCGGDYYNVAELSVGQLGLFIADVSGVGVLTTVLVATIATIVERDRKRWAKPKSLLHHLNQLLCSIELPDGTFVTAFCAVIEAKSGRFTYACAGHPHPRIRSARSGVILTLQDASALPLGIEYDGAYTQREMTVQPDDLLLLYTDGITEARSQSQEFFAVDRLDEVLGALPQSSSAGSAVKQLCDAVAQFSPPGVPRDDQTVVAARFRSAAHLSGAAA